MKKQNENKRMTQLLSIIADCEIELDAWKDSNPDIAGNTTELLTRIRAALDKYQLKVFLVFRIRTEIGSIKAYAMQIITGEEKLPQGAKYAKHVTASNDKHAIRKYYTIVDILTDEFTKTKTT